MLELRYKVTSQKFRKLFHIVSKCKQCKGTVFVFCIAMCFALRRVLYCDVFGIAMCFVLRCFVIVHSCL